MKIGRNEPCPCGSGKKYKHCCYAVDSAKHEPIVPEMKADEPEDASAEEKKSGLEPGKTPHDLKKGRKKFYGGNIRGGGGGANSPRIHRGAQRGS